MAKRVSPRTPARSPASSGTPARAWLLRTTALLPIAFGSVAAAAQTVAPNAGPIGGQVVAGQASITTAPNRTTVTQTTNRGVIDWQRFNVGSQHTVQFQQPNAGSWTLNRVVTSDPSVIAGRIQANGGVAIVNQSGIVFSQGAQVDVGSLIASAPGITNENFMAGRMRFDQAALPGARVENRGRITVPDRGIAVLAGPRVTNSGEIHARLGRVVLAGAETYALDLAGDGLISIDITQAVRGDGAAIVTNEGVIEASGGSVLLTASAAGDLVEGLVRNTGRISANTEAGRTGEVALRAAGGGVEVTGTVTATGGAGQQGGRIAVQSGESVRVATGAVLDASGGAGGGTVLVGTTGVGRNQTMARRTTVERGTTISADATVLGQGGTIAINSTEMTVVEGMLTVRGGPQGGNGGLVELSGQGEMRLGATWDASAPAGQAGSLLLDPPRIEVLDTSDPEAPIPGTGPGTISAVSGNGVLQLSADELSASTGNIILEALLGIRITSAVNKGQGDLTLRTTAAANNPNIEGISIEAPVLLGTGSFTATTNGTFSIATGGSLTVGGATTTITAVGSIAFAGGLTGHDIILNTDGGITQSAAGVNAENLTIRGFAASAASRAASVALTQSGNDIRLLDARTTGALTVISGTTNNVLTIRQADGGGTVLVLGVPNTRLVVAPAGTGGLGVTSDANIVLIGDSVTVNNAVTAGSGGVVAIELRDGGVLAGTGTIAAANGTVQVSAVVGGETAFRIADTGAAGSISASAALLGQVDADTLSIGRSSNNSLTVTAATIGAAVATQAGTEILLEAFSGNVTVGANVTGSGVTLIASGGSVILNAGATIDGGSGRVVLNAADAVTLNGSITGTGAGISSATDDITLGSSSVIDTGASALGFLAAGTVSQNAGAAITAGSLTVLGATGGTSEATAVNLAQDGNAIAAITEIRATGNVAVHAGPGALSVGIVATAGDVALTAGGTVTLTGAVGGDGITITSTGGNITQTAGSIIATDALTLRSDGTISQSGGTISAATLTAGGVTDGTEATAITLGSANNQIAELTAASASGAVTIRSDATSFTVGDAAGSDVTIQGTGAISLTGALTGGTVTLAGADFTQAGGAAITTASLVIQGLAGAGTAAGSASVTSLTNAIEALDARTTGALAVTTTEVLTVQRANGGSVTLTGPSITVPDTAEIRATAGDLILNATSAGGSITFEDGSALTGAGGQRIVLRADALNIDPAATLTLTGTDIEIGPETAGRAVLLASAGTGLSLDATLLGRLTAPAAGVTSLRFGETTISAARPGGALTLGTDLSFAGDLALVGSGAVTLGSQAITAQDLLIQAGGTVTGSGALHTTSLTIRGTSGSAGSSAGDITLDGSDSRLGILDARSSGTIAVTNTGADLTVRQARGSAVTIDALGQGITVQAGGNGITATTEDVALRAASITLNDDVTIEGNGRTLTLQIAGGGTITGSGTLGANGGTVMIGTDVADGALTIGAGGVAASVLNNADASTIIVGQSSFAGGPTISAGTITVSAAVTAPNVETLFFLANTGFTATANISAGSISVGVTGGNITLTNALIAATTAVSGSVILDASGSISQTGGGISAPLFAAAARGGSLSLAGAGNAIRQITNGVALAAASNGFGTLERGLYATGGITLVNTGALSIGAGVEAAGGAVALTSGSVSQQARILASNGAVTLTATGGGGMTLGAEIVADSLTLRSAGDIDQTAVGRLTALSAGSVALTVTGAGGTGAAGGAVTLDQANNDIGTVTAAATDALTLHSVNDTGMTVQAASGSAVTLNASSLSLTGAVDAGSGQVTLTATGGDIGQTATALVTAGTLSASATGDIILDAGDPNRLSPAGWNHVAALGDVTAGGAFVLNTSGALGIAGDIQAAAATIAANGTLGLSSTASIATTGNGQVQLAAAGAVTLAGTINAGSGTVTIGSSGAITQTGGGITAGTFGASGSAIDLALGTNSLGALALHTTIGNLGFDTDGTLTLAGNVDVAMVGGTSSIGGLSSSGDLSISAAVITGGAGTEFRAGAGHSITLRADLLTLDPSTIIGTQGDVGTLSLLSIGPRSSSQAVVIGAADAADTLGLSGATLARLLAVDAPLQIGRTVVGSSTVTATDIRIQAALTANGPLTLIGSNDITFGAATTATSLTAVAGRDILLPATVTATGGGIILSATRAITQTGGGLSAGSGLLVARAGGDIDLLAGNDITTLAARSTGGAVRVAATGSLATGSATDVPLPGGGTEDITGVSAATDVFLQALSLTIAQAVTAGSGNSVTLRADSLDIQANVQAPGGTVAIEPLTLGTGLPLIQIGGDENAGTLSVSSLELSRITAATLIFGRSDGIGNARDLRSSSLGTAWGGTLRLIGSSLTVAGSLTAGSLEAWIAGGISDIDPSGTGVITADSLTVRGLAGGSTDAGSVILTGQNHHIDALDIRGAGTVALALDADTGIIQANQLRGAAVTLIVIDGGLTISSAGATATAGGLILQASGALSIEGPLSVTGGNLGLSGATVTSTAAGDATVTGGNASVNAASADLDGAITANAITLTASGAMDIGGVMTATAGNLTISGATVTSTAAADMSATGIAAITANTGLATLNGDIAGATVNLTANNGALTVGGAINAGSGGLTVSAASVTMTGNATVTGSAAVTATTTADLDGAITAAAITLTAGGAMDIGGVMTAAAGDLTISGATVTSAAAADMSATGTAAITATTGFATLDGDITAHDISLTVDSGLLSIGGALRAVNGSLVISAASIDIADDAVITGNSVSITIGGPADFGGAITAGAITLVSSGAMTIDGVMTATSGDLTITGTSVTVTADASATGTAAVTATTGSATLNGGITAGAITLTAAGAMSIGGAINAGSGGLTVSAASVTMTGNATVTGSASVTATTTADLDGAITAAAISLAAGGALTVDGTLSATAGDLAIHGGSVIMTATAGAAGNATVIADTTASLGGAITADNVTLTAGGAMDVDAAMAATSGDLTIHASGLLTTTGSLTAANDASVAGDAGVVLGGSLTATGGDVMLTAASGGIAVNSAVAAAAGNVVINAAQALVLNANVTAAATGAVVLRAGTTGLANAAYTITQTSGVIGGAGGGTTSLVIDSRSAAATLERGNRIAALNATAVGALSVVSTGALTVAQAVGGGSVTLAATALTLTGAVGAAGGTVDLTATTGGVAQNAAGIITAQTLTGDVAGDVALATAANAVAQTGAFSFGGNFALRTSANLTVTTALTAASGRSISLQAGNNLVLDASLRADTVSLAAAGGISQTDGVIASVSSGVATSLDARGAAGVTLNSAANAVGTLTGGDGGSGGFQLRNNRNLAITGLVQTGADTTIRLDTAGSLTLAAGGALNAAGGAVALMAEGAVTLGGTINAANASITTAAALQQSGGGIATTGILAVQAADIDLQAAGNAIAQLTAAATAGSVAVASTGSMTITGAGNVALHGGGTTTLSGVSGGTVLLTAAGLEIGQAVTATQPGGTVTLRADGTRGISLGSEIADALSLTTGELARISAATLVIGRGDGGHITVAGDVAAPGSIGTLSLLGSGIEVNASLAGPAGGVTELLALNGSITTAASGRVTGQRLVASAPVGSIGLSGPNNFTEVTGNAAGSFAYRDSNGFTVAAPGIQAGSVILGTDAGSITQQAGAAIAAATLEAQAAAGSVLLDGGSEASGGADLNRIGAVSRLAAASGGLARLRNAQGFDMAGLIDNGAGGALGTLQLFAATGSITQSGGAIRVARLEARTPGGSLLLGQANGITTLGTTQVAGDLAITNDGSLTLAAPADVGSFSGGGFGTAMLTVNNGDLRQTAGARLSADRLVANAPTGSVVLDGGGSTNPADLLRVADLAGGYAAQSMVLRFGNAVTVTGLVQAGATSGTPTGTLALEAPGIAIGVPGQDGALLRAGSVVLRTQADFDGPAIPGSGSIVQQGGLIEAVNLAASAPDGDVLLGLTGNRFNALAPGFSANGAASTRSLVAGGSIDIAEGGPGFIVLGGLQNDGGGIQLRSLGNLTFNAATSVGGPMDLSAGGVVTIGTAADLRSGTLLTLNGSGIVVQGAITAPGVIASTGGTFTLTGSGRITGGAGAGGSVSVAAGHVETNGGTITAHDITVQTGTGTIANTGFAAQNLVNIRAGGALQVTGIGVNADAMQARTNGLLTLAGGSYTIGSVVVFAGSAGITMDSAVQVRSRDSGVFPAIVLDSRAPGSQPDPLTIVRPDVAGLAPDLQETQVRQPNTDTPGDFGTSSNAPAGTIRFNLDAQQSPLFLLIDGGSATGIVNTSGRIGIHGRGGSVDITGTIIDPSGQRIEGQATARMTDATRPASGTEISRFRINDCVVSSFNCVSPAQVIVVPTAVPPPPPLVYGGVGRDPDTVSPNVSEEWTAPGDDDEEDKR